MDQSPQAESMNQVEAASAIEQLLGGDEAETQEQQQQAPETEEAETEEVSDDTTEEEADEEDGETATSEETDEDSSEEQGSIETLTELAEALDLPLEEVMANLKTTVKVNGKEQVVTLKEAFDGYQKDADYRQKTTELANHRREFEQQEQYKLGILNQEFQTVGYMVNQLEKLLVPDDPNLEQLKQKDPAAYLLRKQENDDRRKLLLSLKRDASDKLNQLQQISQEQQRQRMEQIFETARQELPKRVPGWGKEIKEQIDTYLTSENYGFSMEELAEVSDPRLVELAHKAFLYDQGKSAADVAKKKVKLLPKVQQPGKQAPAVTAKKAALTKARSRLKSTGHYKDAASLIEQFL